jgi:tetratricopeptide (TPR) repeat protein
MASTKRSADIPERNGPKFEVNKDRRNTGPETRARFRYQDECLALRCIASLSSDEVDFFVTEWATDYIVQTRDGRRELVSVKHRDPNQGEWTLSRLKQSRAFADLYRIWQTNGKSSYCAFESNAGFEGPARKIHLACTRRSPEDIAEAVPILARHLAISNDKAREFIQVLALGDSPLPKRHDITDVAVRMLVAILEQLNLDSRMADTCYEALVERISAAATDEPPAPSVRIQRLRGLVRVLADQAESQHLATRTLRMADLRELVIQTATTGLPGSSLVESSILSDPLFTGRTEEVRQLENYLQPGGREPVAPVVLHGLTGQGKTALALEFAARHRRALTPYVVSGESRAALLNGLARLTGQPLSPMNSQTPVFAPGVFGVGGHVTPVIPIDARCLLIVDGVVSPAVLEELIPRESATRILITTTCQHLDDAFVHVPIQHWPREDSVAYIQRLLVDEPMESADKLAQHLYDHPLALAAAVNYCLSERLDIPSYLVRLKEEPAITLDLGKASGHPESVLRAVTLSLHRVSSHEQAALDLLSVLSFLGSDPVPEQLFASEREIIAFLELPKGKPSPWWRRWQHAPRVNRYPKMGDTQDAAIVRRQWSDRARLDRCVAVLHQFSLLQRRQFGLSTHPLVRLIVRETSAKNSRTMWLQIALGLFAFDVSGSSSASNDLLDRSVPHLIEVLEHSEVLDTLPPICMAAHERLAVRLSELGDGKQAIKHARRAIDLAERIGINGAVIRCRSALVLCLSNARDFGEALKVVDETISLAEDSGSMWAVASTKVLRLQLLMQSESYSEAEVALRDLDDLLNAGMLNPAQELIYEHSLAGLLYARQDLEEALEHLRRAEELLELIDFDKDLYRLRILELRADIFRDLGKTQEAVAVRESVLAGFRAHSGGPDMNVAVSLANLADKEIDSGLLTAAQRHCDEALEVARGLVGEDDPFYGRLLVVKGRAALASHDLNEAYRILPKAISVMRAGPNTDRDLAVALYHVAQVYSARGQHRRAIEAATEARDIELSIFGPLHIEVAKDEALLAQILAVSGRLKDAEMAAERCLKSLGDVKDDASVQIHEDLAFVRYLVSHIRRTRGR